MAEVVAQQVPAGYQALRERAAWLELAGRGKIRLTGEDRARLLHAMTTNNIQELTPGSGCYAFFLSAQGRILADVNIFCRPDEFLLDTEAETREKVFQHLDKYIIADDVTLDDATDRLVTIAIEGPESAQVLKRLGAPPPECDYAHAVWGERLIARVSFCGGAGFWIFAPAGVKDQLLAELGAAGVAAASPQAFEVVRLELGTPRYGSDLSERFLAQEANIPKALNFNKGCYLGQEIVERVRSRGQVHRMLVPLEIESVDVPAPGTKYTAGGVSIAEITSAAYSPAHGRVMAMAYVRTDKAKPGTEVMLGETKARVGQTHTTISCD